MSKETIDLTKFMHNKNKEAKGETIFKEKEIKEEELPGIRRPTEQNTEEGAKSDKGLLLLRRILNIVVTVPIIATIIGLVGYASIKFMPYIIAILRRIFIILMVGGNRY